MLKKLTSFILCLVMFFSYTTSVCAENMSVNDTQTAIVDITGGKLFTSKNNEKTIAILTNDAEHLLDVSISYVTEPNTVYQWTIQDYPENIFFTDDILFWEEIINYVEERMGVANIVCFTENQYDQSIEIQKRRSSAGADLVEELEELMGTSEYFNTLKTTVTYQGQVFRVYENMEFRIYETGTKSWTNAISVSSLIVGVLGLVTTNALVATICGAFGVGLSAASLLPANGSINIYKCRVMNYRYVTVNGSSYHYNITYRVVDYTGYENADINNTERAYIDSSSMTEEYTESSTYFNAYMSQIQDAYMVFNSIGQKD